MKNTRSEFLQGLAELQTSTSPIHLSIGWTDPNTNQVHSEYLMITKAAPIVINYVTENVTSYNYRIQDGGLLIRFDK